MSSTTLEHPVRDVMSAGERPSASIVSGAAFEVLIGLFALTNEPRSERSWPPRSLEAAPARVRKAIERIGPRSGELWLHLLGAALESSPGIDASGFVDYVADLDANELRRHVVGVYVPAWREVVGAEALERAAAGDRTAQRRLLADDRYYGGEAADALTNVLPLSAAATRRRVLDALRAFVDDVFVRHEVSLTRELEREASARRPLIRALSVEQLVTAVVPGYAYVREPELPHVVLVPHAAARPWMLLCQHRSTRLICYAAPTDDARAGRDVHRRALELGRALGDLQRLRILERLRQGPASLSELAEEAGVAKSTAHHHLAHLRTAGLVTLRGNARSYTYSLRADGLGDARAVLGELLTPR
jgi:DNA-binding transcriptional ArsR family regulator